MKILSSPPKFFFEKLWRASPAALFILILAGTLSANFVLAADPLDVIINEIAWMGTKASYADEWIELYNNTEASINLDGWLLKGINLTEVIAPGSFYLLERTDDNTVPNILADQIYTGVLNNKGESLEIYDNSGNLIDSIYCKDGWPAGNNSTKQTMERKGADSWQTSQDPEGTPKAKNSEGEIFTEPALTETAQTEEKPVGLNKREPAALGGQIPQTSSFPLFIPVTIAIFSGIIILIFKKR